MTSPSETIAKALEGVTHAPGPWVSEDAAVYCDDRTGQRVADCKGEYLFWSKEEIRANADYIAACNPVAMREVLDELCALREAALQVEAMTREMAELRDSLSDVLELAERQWANPEELSEIRRARTLIQGDKP